MRIFHGQKTSKRPAVNKTALCFEKFEAEGLFVVRPAWANTRW